MSNKDKYGRSHKSEEQKKNYHPSSHPNTQHTQPMKNVCNECGYYGGDHAPKCSKGK